MSEFPQRYYPVIEYDEDGQPLATLTPSDGGSWVTHFSWQLRNELFEFALKRAEAAERERDELRERLEREIARTAVLYHERDVAVADLAVMKSERRTHGATP